MREFVYRLLHDPESLRRQTLAQFELDRAGLGRVEEEAAFLLEQLAEADRERDGYLRLTAKGRISEEELDRYLTELEQRKDAARRELAGPADRRERLAKLEELTETVEEYLGDLPQIIHGGQTSIGAEHRAERYRWAYELLGLRVVAHRDRTLELTWRAGSEVLGPEEPRELELPPPTTAAGHCPNRATPRGRGTRGCTRDATGWRAFAARLHQGDPEGRKPSQPRAGCRGPRRAGRPASRGGT